MTTANLARTGRHGLTAARETFCQARVNGGPDGAGLKAEAAYLIAYPRAQKWNSESVRKEAARLLRHERVALRIDELQRVKSQIVSQETGITFAKVLNERAKAAFFNLRRVIEAGPDGRARMKDLMQWSEDDLAAVAGVVQHVDRNGFPTSIELKFYSKLEALRDIGKQLKYDVDAQAGTGRDGAAPPAPTINNTVVITQPDRLREVISILREAGALDGIEAPAPAPVIVESNGYHAA